MPLHLLVVCASALLVVCVSALLVVHQCIASYMYVPALLVVPLAFKDVCPLFW